MGTGFWYASTPVAANCCCSPTETSTGLGATLRVASGPARMVKAIGSDFKGKVSVVIYLAGIALAFVNAWIGLTLYTIVAIIWLIPDRRIEKTLAA